MSDLYLYVYDLTKGMARQFSAMFLGKHFDGVWHTGIVAFGKEWYFGNDGIDSCPPKGTVLGEPNEIIHLGKTELNEADFNEVIRQMSDSSYKVGTYNLLEHNCNNFSNDLSLILVGKPIPSHIIDLPKEILNTPLGPFLKPLLEQAADPIHEYRSGNTPTFGASRLFQQSSQPTTSSAKPATTSQSTQPKTLERKPSTINFFKQSLATDEFSTFLKVYENSSDYNLLVEVKDFLSQVEVKWSIGPNHIKCLIKLIESEKNLSNKQTLFKILQLISTNEELASLIANEDLFLKKFLATIKDLETIELKYLALQKMSNLCSNKPISEKLLDNYQDLIFADLYELTLIQAGDEQPNEQLLHEAAISFFFNLVSAYHLEKKLKDANAFTLGTALLDRLPKLKAKPRTIYQMLSLLRSCLTNSQNIRELALSMEFDLAKYDDKNSQQGVEFSANTSRPEATTSKNDSYESILKNINDLIHQ